MLPPTPFGFHSTGDEVAAGMDLHGKRVIVTGGSTGVGAETARVLADRGADVTITTRNAPAGQRVAAGIRELTGNQLVRHCELDLTDRRSINRFLNAWASPVDILINNAGVRGIPELGCTTDGWELHFGINFFGHFRLTVGLFDQLAAATGGARVVSVSSSAHLYCPVVFDDINFDFRAYDTTVAFGQSETAAILLAVAVNAQWASAGISANAVNPGTIAADHHRYDSGLRTSSEGPKPVQHAAATSIFAAVSPLLDGVGGRYLEDCHEAPVVSHRPAEPAGVAPYALDPDNAERLWAHASQAL